MRGVFVLLACSACVGEPPRPTCSGPPRAMSDPALSTGNVDNDQDPWLSYDRLELLFSSDRISVRGGTQIWRTVRPSLDAAFDAPRELDLGDGSEHFGPWLSDDGLTLYYSTTVPDPMVAAIWAATRPDRTTDVFSNLHLVVSAGGHPSLTSDEKTIYYYKSVDPSGEHLYRASRGSTTEPFTKETRLDELATVNSTQRDPSISGDGTTLIYALKDSTGQYLSRTHLGATVFAPPEPVAETRIPNATGDYLTPMLHRDAATILFASDIIGGPTTKTHLFITCE